MDRHLLFTPVNTKDYISIRVKTSFVRMQHSNSLFITHLTFGNTKSTKSQIKFELIVYDKFHIPQTKIIKLRVKSDSLFMTRFTNNIHQTTSQIWIHLIFHIHTLIKNKIHCNHK